MSTINSSKFPQEEKNEFSHATFQRNPNSPENPYEMVLKENQSEECGIDGYFDMALAAKFGIEGAILIKHFKFWVSYNKRLNRNFKEGRTWTYQTRKEIQAHFPYLSFQTIRYQLEKLVRKGVLITKNFNKSNIDKTLWYAFSNEEKYIKCDFFSKNVHEREEPLSEKKFEKRVKNQPNSKNVSESGKPHTKAVNRTPIPDNLSTDIDIKDIVSDPPPAAGLTAFFFEKLKEINPKIRSPNLKEWQRTMALIKGIDGRTDQEIRDVIYYIAEQHKNPKREFTWSKAVASPEKLRKHFAAIWLEMNTKTETQKQESVEEQKLKIIKENIAFAKELHKKVVSRLNADVDFRLESNLVTLVNRKRDLRQSVGYLEHQFKQILEKFFKTAGIL